MSFFKLRLCAFLEIARNKKWYFWNPEIKLFHKHTFLFGNTNSKIWPYMWTGFWPEPSLSLICMGTDCKMASIFLILQAQVIIHHVPHARKNFWFWWSFMTFRDIPRLDIDSDPYLVKHLCSRGIFNNPLRLLWMSFEQKLSILPALGFIV